MTRVPLQSSQTLSVFSLFNVKEFWQLKIITCQKTDSLMSSFANFCKRFRVSSANALRIALLRILLPFGMLRPEAGVRFRLGIYACFCLCWRLCLFLGCQFVMLEFLFCLKSLSKKNWFLTLRCLNIMQFFSYTS